MLRILLRVFSANSTIISACYAEIMPLNLRIIIGLQQFHYLVTDSIDNIFNIIAARLYFRFSFAYTGAVV